ncbi:MAG: universal stress protein [Deltaproteobacteria bacterium]|nr:universal stress protein [Deltaproteobacteria bacterium]
MKRFKNILLVTGERPGERATVARAAALAKRNRARLTLVEVIEQLPREMKMLITVAPPSDLVKLAVKDRRERLEGLAAPLRDLGIRVSAAVLSGTPFLEVIRQVVRRKHDLVILTAEGKGGLKERLFGSTSLHLLRKCPCPVWVMKPTRRKRYGRILAAIDPDASDSGRDGLNVMILDLATSLARIEESRLSVVHVWGLPGEALYRSGRTRVQRKELEAMLAEIEEVSRRRVNELLGRYALDDIRHDTYVLKGEAGDLIPELVRESKADLLVMGTVCRTGVPGFFIGNTAETVLQHVDCSLLAVKPKAFVSPVKPKPPRTE